eukprot:jgi/Tetstr1/427769/TSEL_017887.t1
MEGEELRAAAVQHRETVELRSRLSAAEISAEQINHAARDAHSKLYQHRYNVRKRKHGADEEDCDAGDESGSESAEGGDNSESGPLTEVAVLVSPESLHATEAAQPHRH